MKNNKYIIICKDEKKTFEWNNNIIYHGNKATNILPLLELKKSYPKSIIYKLTEIKL